MFDVGFWEIILIFGLGLMILGPEKLPRVAAQLGRWVGRARRTASQLRYQLEREIDLDDKPRSRYTPPPKASHMPPPGKQRESAEGEETGSEGEAAAGEGDEAADETAAASASSDSDDAASTETRQESDTGA